MKKMYLFALLCLLCTWAQKSLLRAATLPELGKVYYIKSASNPSLYFMPTGDSDNDADRRIALRADGSGQKAALWYMESTTTANQFNPINLRNSKCLANPHPTNKCVYICGEADGDTRCAYLFEANETGVSIKRPSNNYYLTAPAEGSSQVGISLEQTYDWILEEATDAHTLTIELKVGSYTWASKSIGLKNDDQTSIDIIPADEYARYKNSMSAIVITRNGTTITENDLTNITITENTVITLSGTAKLPEEGKIYHLINARYKKYATDNGTGFGSITPTNTGEQTLWQVIKTIGANSYKIKSISTGKYAGITRSGQTVPLVNESEAMNYAITAETGYADYNGLVLFQDLSGNNYSYFNMNSSVLGWCRNDPGTYWIVEEVPANQLNIEYKIGDLTVNTAKVSALPDAAFNVVIPTEYKNSTSTYSITLNNESIEESQLAALTAANGSTLIITGTPCMPEEHELYRIRNFCGRYAYEDGVHNLKLEADKTAGRLEQMFYVYQMENGNYRITNAKSNSTVNRMVTSTQTTSTLLGTAEFTITIGNKGLITIGNPGAKEADNLFWHKDGANNIVGWNTTADNTHWYFEKVDRTLENLAERADLTFTMTEAGQTAINNTIYAVLNTSISGILSSIKEIGIKIANYDYTLTVNGQPAESLDELTLTQTTTVNVALDKPKMPEEGKWYRIINNGDAGRQYRRITRSALSSHTVLTGKPEDVSSINQLWAFVPAGDGTYYITSYLGEYVREYNSTSGNYSLTTDKAQAAKHTLAHKVYGTHSSATIKSNAMWHCANTGENIIISYDDQASGWYFEEVKDAALPQASLAYYQAMLAAPQVLPYYHTVLNASQLSTNAQQNNPVYGDHTAVVANLIDGNASTYFHSRYSNADGETALTEDHYLQVDLGEGNEVDVFAFTLTKRNNNNIPTIINVLGSNDGDNFTDIITVDKGNASPYSSEAITAAAKYRYLRFQVTATNTPGSTWDNHPYFTLSEFRVYGLNAAGNMPMSLARELVKAAAQGDVSSNAIYADDTVLEALKAKVAEVENFGKLFADYQSAINKAQAAISGGEELNLGTEVHQYTFDKATAQTALNTYNTEAYQQIAANLTVTDYQTALGILKGSLPALNAPKTGQIYLLQSLNGGAYVKTDGSQLSAESMNADYSNETALMVRYTADSTFEAVQPADETSVTSMSAQALTFAEHPTATGNYRATVAGGSLLALNNGILSTVTADNDAAQTVATAWRIVPVQSWTVNLNKVSDSSNWATFYADTPVHLPTGVTARYIESAELTETGTEGVMALSYTTFQGTILPANTGVLLVSETTGQQTIYSSVATGVSAVTNIFKGIAHEGETLDVTGTLFALGKPEGAEPGFYRYDSTDGFAPNKAYLALTLSTDLANTASILLIERPSTPTGIESVTDKDNEGNNIYYDLSGKRVTNPTRPGIYIKNHKKIVIK